MSDAIDAEDVRLAGQFRHSRRPMWIAIGINVVVAAVFFGAPYVRGRLRAGEARASFARFSACLLRGQAAKEPGLGLPPGDRDHYATAVLHAGERWPQRCMAPLRAIAPQPADFLFPRAKQAEHDVRAAVAIVERELQRLSAKRDEGLDAVPTRPWRAVSKLRAALSLWAEASGATEALRADAVVLPDAPELADPARVPLRAAYDAQLYVRGHAKGLEAFAMDERGVSWVRVRDGKVQQRRARRPSLLRSLLLQEDRGYLVWAMPESRCEGAEDSCIHHATGIAPIDGPELRPLPEPLWLAAHPAGRIDRSLRLDGRTATLLARASTQGAVELRTFTLPPRPEGDDSEFPKTPVAASRRWALPDVPADTLLVSAPHPGVAWATTDSDATHIWWKPDAGDAESIGTLSGAAPWLAHCASETTRWLVYGTRSQMGITRFGPDGTASTQLEQRIAVASPRHATRPGLDTLETACTPERLDVAFRNAESALAVVHCEAGTPSSLPRCGAPRMMANDVGVLALAAYPKGSVVAYSATATRSFVHVRALDRRGEPRGKAQIPAACWHPSAGFCGVPTLVQGRPMLLAARERGDLRVVEQSPKGAWQPLEGLRRKPVSASPTLRRATGDGIASP